MRRSLGFALAAASLIVSTAFASPTNPQSGVEYTTLSAPQATQKVGKKVEVIEFFAYHCPACNMLEPELNTWVKKQGDKINFRRMHLPFQGEKDPEAHLFLTLQAMGKEESMHARVFQAVHGQRIRLLTDEQIIEWVAKNGIDRAKFLETWNSFGVVTKLKGLSKATAAYQVSGTPTLIVDGKYMTSPSQVAGATKLNDNKQVVQAHFQVLDALVAKAAATK